MEKCKFGFGDWSILRISGKSLTQINYKKILRRFEWKRNADSLFYGSGIKLVKKYILIGKVEQTTRRGGSNLE